MMFSDLLNLDSWDHGEPKEQRNSNQFKCFDCGKVYKYKQSLQLHKRSQCGKEPQYRCNLCSKQFYQTGNLKRHMFLIHGSAKNM